MSESANQEEMQVMKRNWMSVARPQGSQQTGSVQTPPNFKGAVGDPAGRSAPGLGFRVLGFRGLVMAASRSGVFSVDYL